MRKILVTGALGQIGTELVPALQKHYGKDRVIASDIRMGPTNSRQELVDCTQIQQIHETVRHHDIGMIFHMAAMLSAVAEEKPQIAWRVNMDGLYNVLEVARQQDCAVFFPSSIGAFGPETPRDKTPQTTIQRPNTMYGVTKVAGELLCDYYAHRFNVDTRGVRLPGLISYQAPPGGGTTDYVVEIFYSAIRYQHYTCFLEPHTCLDMMYMPDAVRAMIELMSSEGSLLQHRNAFNITAMSFTPEDLADEIRKHIPDFVIEYEIDPVRQAIADTWPRSLDDSAARAEWGWQPGFDIATMTGDMIGHLGRKLKSAKGAN